MKKLAITLLLLCATALPAFAILPPPETINTELGITRMKATYPAPGSIISETMPIIAVDLSQLVAPVDMDSVKIMLDRADVTQNADITPAYILYTPPAALKSGIHEVRILANDLTRRTIEPLSWTFTVKADAAAAPKEIIDPFDLEEKPSNTVGSLFVSTDYVSADFEQQPFFDISQLFNEKEGMKLNTELNFSNISTGRSISAAYSRDTLPYMDTERDRGHMFYSDSNFSASLGNFWFRMSDLTVVGTELAGFKIDKPLGDWNLAFFAGRTQDPSLDGTYKQTATGFQGGYTWSKKNTTSITGISAWESSDLYYSTLTGFPQPARDDIATVAHEYRPSRDITARLELASNVRKERTGNRRLHDSAAKFEIRVNKDQFSGEAELYDIGENYMPVSDGNAKFLNNDRAGIKLRGRYQPAKILTVGGEYEQYDTPSTDKTARRGSAFAALSSGAVQSLTLRREKLGSETGVGSDNTGLTLVLAAKNLGPMSNTRLTAGWQNIDYNTPSATADTTVTVLAFSSRIARRLTISLGWSNSDGTSYIASQAGLPMENENLYFGIDWDIVPYRLAWMWKYETVDNSGFNTDNDEQRLKTALKYNFSKDYNMTLGMDWIDYSDSITPGNDYSQNIVRTGMGMNF